MTSDFLTIDALTPSELLGVLGTAGRMKAHPGMYSEALSGHHAVMLFEKPSLRTRVSFELGIRRLGGSAMYYGHDHERIGQRETVHDYAKNLERYADVIIARVFSHAVLEEMAHHASVPVVNALSDMAHPCQALADMMTLWEHAQRTGIAETAGMGSLRLAYIGDGNNVCHSLMLAASLLGMQMTVIHPEGYGPSEAFIERARAAASEAGSDGHVTSTTDLAQVRGHHAVYTDVWVSMGQGDEAEERMPRFEPYRVTTGVMQAAGEGLGVEPIFMHCLPAHRGEEVESAVVDGPHSVVFDQAENRMWAQNAMLIKLLAGDGDGDQTL